VLGEIGNFLEPLNPIKYYEAEIECRDASRAHDAVEEGESSIETPP
jgi:hypothetical protein